MEQPTDEPVAIQPESAAHHNNADSCTSDEWVSHFCVVDFDADAGQILERVYPEGLTDAEMRGVCALSFPDSNAIAGNTDEQFSFRIPCHSAAGQDFWYCYVFFRQTREMECKRGYKQKSLVLLTRHSFGHGLFKRVASIVANLYFQHGTTLLEAAHQNILSWQAPVPGITYELPLLGTVLSFHVPFSSNHIIDPPRQPKGPSARPKISNMEVKEIVISNLHSLSVYTALKELLPQLWLLWELVLVNAPIAVISPSPSAASDTVLSLVSLIAPLQYGGDYRPYFTIQDADLKLFTAKKPPPAIVGVTNPCFANAFRHWPNILYAGNSRLAQDSNRKQHASPRLTAHSPTNTSSEKDLFSSLLPSFKTSQPLQRLESNTVPVMETDKALLQRLEDLLAQPDASPTTTTRKAERANLVVRRYFLRLTELFLIPLERYFASRLMPRLSDTSPFDQAPRLRRFDAREFLSTIGKDGRLAKGIKIERERELYARFLRSENFKIWYKSRRLEALAHLRTLYIQALVDADMGAWVASQTLTSDDAHLRLVDMYILLTSFLSPTPPPPGRKSTRPPPPPLEPAAHQALTRHVNLILSALPTDIRPAVQQNFQIASCRASSNINKNGEASPQAAPDAPISTPLTTTPAHSSA